MATLFLDHPTIGIVKRVLSILWNLRVLCPCDDICRATCLNTSRVAMGYSLVLSTEGLATAYIQPSSLTPQYELKLGHCRFPLAVRIPNTSMEFSLECSQTHNPGLKVTWHKLLSVAAWCQVAVLNGYLQRDTRRAMHSAIVRSYATSDHDYTRKVAYVHQIVLRVPQPRCCHLHQALQWVKGHGVWAHQSYTSWRLTHHVSVDGATGD